MRVLRLTIALSLGLCPLASCSLKERLLPPANSSQEIDTPPATNAAKTYESARKLAWEAALMVQHPPHRAETWQEAKVKWRQAIRLMESVPEGTPVSPEAKRKLSQYQVSYAAIRDRLSKEQTASENLTAAQKLAWQAAVLVQNPPHSLKTWQRAQQKWQEAIALLEPIPPSTSVAKHQQAKLATYRSNEAAIDQQIEVELRARKLLEQFAAVSNQLNTIPNRMPPGITTNQLGIRYEEFAELVDRLDSDLSEFSKQPAGRLHPIYGALNETITDYHFTLKLWDAYRAYKQANSAWLYDDLFNLLVPVSFVDSTTLTQKYRIKSYGDGTKVSLKFSAWEIWSQADDRIRETQQMWEQVK